MPNDHGPQAARKRRGDGERSRGAIVAEASRLATVEGFEGLSIARLADAVGMSKSGLFAHFGSKEELQLAVVDVAREQFEKRVLPAGGQAERGLPRLLALLMAWTDHIEHTPHRGGCFFAAASAEFDDRAGPVRDKVARLTKLWVDGLIREAAAAKSLGELRPEADPRQIAFEVHAFVQEANWAKQLHSDPRAFERARRAIRTCLQREATAKGRRSLSVYQYGGSRSHDSA
jgi:AcrR family transcriptional regulator